MSWSYDTPNCRVECLPRHPIFFCECTFPLTRLDPGKYVVHLLCRERTLLALINTGLFCRLYAFSLTLPEFRFPIPGTTKINRLEENLGAASVELTTADLEEIDQAFTGVEVEGARYPENMQRLVGR
jgi:hypothetical protein